MKRLPESILSDEGIGENEEFSHDGGDGDFGLFSAGDETVVEDFEGWIVSRGGKGGHVQGASQVGSSASDVARAVVLAAVVGDGGKADDHGGLFGGERAEFDEADDEGDSGCDPDAGDGGEDSEAAGKERIGGDQALDFGLEIGDGGFEGAELTLELEDGGGVLLAPSWLRRAVRAARAASRQRSNS